MKDVVTINEREFISVRRASEMTKYSKDYIGQLCREGKVAARMLGRTWFIDSASLINHQKSTDTFYTGRRQRVESGENITDSVSIEQGSVARSEPVSRATDDIQASTDTSGSSYIYAKDDRELLPSLSKSKVGSARETIRLDGVAEATKAIKDRTRVALGSSWDLMRQRIMTRAMMVIIGLVMVGSIGYAALDTQTISRVIDRSVGMVMSPVAQMSKTGTPLVAGIGEAWDGMKCALSSALFGSRSSCVVSEVSTYAIAPSAPVTTVGETVAPPTISVIPTIPAKTIVERIIQPQTVIVERQDDLLAQKLDDLEYRFIAEQARSRLQVDAIYDSMENGDEDAGSGLVDLSSISGSTISNSTIVSSSFSGTTGAFSSDVSIGGQLTVSGTGTSTFANGIDLDGGCLAIDGVCITGAGAYGDADVNSYISASSTIPKTYATNTFTGAQTFTGGLTASGLTVGSLSGPLQAIGGDVSASSTISSVYGGTGFSTYAEGDILYANSAGVLTRLPRGSNGLVLKLSGGIPGWYSDLTSSGGGGAAAWATTSDSLAVYPSDTSNVVLIGTNATSTTGDIFEVSGNSRFGGNVTLTGGLTISGNATTTSLAITGVSDALLATDADGTIIATTTLSTGYLSGSLGTVNGTAFNAGDSITISTASSTILSDNNTWSGSNSFANAPVLGSLSGLIGANSGTLYQIATSSAFVTSLQQTYGSAQTGALTFATSSAASWNGLTISNGITNSGSTFTFAPATISGTLSAGGGGTGISSPSAAGILLGSYAGGGWQQLATSSLGLLTTNIAEGSNLYYTDARARAAISEDVVGLSYNSSTGVLSTTTGYVIPLVASTTEWNSSYQNRITSATSPLSISNNIISLSTAGDWTGTLDGQEGSYYLANSFSTTSAVYWDSTVSRWATTSTDYWFTTKTTDDLSQGSSNLYYSNALVNSYISASSTIPKTYASNTFTGTQAFNGSNTFGGSAAFNSTLTVGSLNGPLQANNGVVSATSSVGVLYGGTGITSAPTYGQLLLGNASGGYALTATSSLGLPTFADLGSYASFAYPFPSNATSTALSFTGGLTSYASTTIGDGSTTGGLTISGNATTTGNAYVAGNITTAGSVVVGSGNLNQFGVFTGNGVRLGQSGIDISASNGNIMYMGSGYLQAWRSGSHYYDGSPDVGLSRYGAGVLAVGNGTLSDYSGTLIAGNVGIGTTSPYAKLSVDGRGVFNQDVRADYFTATSTSATSTLPNLLATNLRVSGQLYDGSTSAGSLGSILQSTGSGTQWVATSSLGIAFSSISGTLDVSQGGTGGSSFGQGWVYSPGGTSALAASTSPTVNYITSTSTSATSTFAYDVSIAGALDIARSNGSVVAGDVTGNARGSDSIDIQSGRSSSANVASGNSAVALGYDNRASGVSAAITVGALNVASGLSVSSAFGYSNTASANSSSAFGTNNTASNVETSAFGRLNTASGNASSAFGYNNVVSAGGASVFGSGITNAIANSTMIGPSDSAKLTILSTGETRASYFTATSTTASTFPYASTTALTSSASAYLATSGGAVLIGTTTATTTTKLAIAGGSIVHSAVGSPTLVGSYDTSGSSVDVFVSGTYGYVADGTSGIQILDVSDPRAPTLVKTYDISGTATTITGSADYLYVWDSANFRIRIIDVSNPASPAVVGTVTSINAYGIYPSGKFLYVATGGSGISVIDISDPRAPRTTGSYDTSGFANAVYVVGPYAYVADDTGGLQIVDISNPVSPVLVGTYNSAGTATAVYVSDRYAYLADGFGSGMLIIDVSNPVSPSLVGSYTSGADYISSSIRVFGDYAYMNNAEPGNQQFVVVDVSRPSAPSLVGTLTTVSTRSFVSGTYAYLTAGSSGLKIARIDGFKTPSTYAGSVEAGTVSVRNNVLIGGDIYAQGGLTAGISGIFSRGTISAFVASTTQANPVVANFMGGNVGIGTTSPYAKLSVDGRGVFNQDVRADYFTATSTSATSTLPNLLATNLRVSGQLYDGSTSAGSLGSILQSTGSGTQWVATSSLGMPTFTDLSLYLTSASAAATYLTQTSWYATTTDGLTQGSSNLYYSNALVNSYISASSTIPKTYASNTFTGTQAFNGSNTFGGSAAFNSTLTIGSLNGPLQANGGVVSATSSIGVLYGGTGLTSAPSYGQILLGNASGGYALTATSSLGLPTFADLASTSLEVFNVKDYGAVGDGVSDDTAAIASAFSDFADSCGILYFPSGTYRDSGSHEFTTFCDNATLGVRGGLVLGNRNSQWKYTGTGVFLKGLASFKDIAIVGPSTGSPVTNDNTTGWWIETTPNPTGNISIDNVMFQYWGDAAMKTGTTSLSSITYVEGRNVAFYNNRRGFAGGYKADSWFLDGRCNSNDICIELASENRNNNTTVAEFYMTGASNRIVYLIGGQGTNTVKLGGHIENTGTAYSGTTGTSSVIQIGHDESQYTPIETTIYNIDVENLWTQNVPSDGAIKVNAAVTDLNLKGSHFTNTTGPIVRFMNSTADNSRVSSDFGLTILDSSGQLLYRNYMNYGQPLSVWLGDESNHAFSYNPYAIEGLVQTTSSRLPFRAGWITNSQPLSTSTLSGGLQIDGTSPNYYARLIGNTALCAGCITGINPTSKFHFYGNDGEAYTNLFRISSTTASATTTLFNITNKGTVSVTDYIDFGTNIFQEPNMYWYNGGASARSGVGINSGEVQFFTVNSGSNHWSWNAGGDLQTIGTNERMRLEAVSGELGVGDTDPDFQIEVVDDFAVSSTPNADGDRFIVNSSGNVGIGTTSPYAKLSVAGQVVAGYFTATSTATSTFANGINISSGCFAINGTCVGGGSGSGTVGSGTAGQFPYYASSGTTLTATSSININPTTGNIAIGKAADSIPKLDILGQLYVKNTDQSFFDVDAFYTGNATFTGSPVQVNATGSGGKTLFGQWWTVLNSGDINSGAATIVGDRTTVESQSDIGKGSDSGTTQNLIGKYIDFFVLDEFDEYEGTWNMVGIYAPPPDVTASLLTQNSLSLYSGDDSMIASNKKLYFEGSYNGSTLTKGDTYINYNSTAGSLNVVENGTNSITSKSGNVGIGTTSPFARLSVTGAGTGTGTTFQVADSSNVPKFTLLDNGTVSIGTTTASNMVNIQGTGSNVMNLYSSLGQRLYSFTDSVFNIGGNGANPSFLMEAANGADWFQVNGGTISFNGQGGTTDAGSNIGARFDIYPVNDSTDVLHLKLPSSANSNYFLISSPSSSAGDVFIVKGAGTGGYVGISTTSPWRKLSVAGTVGFDGLTAAVSSGDALCLSSSKEVVVNTGAQTCTVSSARFKNSVSDLSVGLDELKQLRPVSFLYNGSDDARVGFLAEEVGEIDPRLIFTELDGTTPRGVRYEDMTALLVKAVQEQQLQIEELALNVFEGQLASTSTTTIASTTAAALSLDQSFIGRIAEAVIGLFRDAGEWAVDVFTARIIYAERIEVQTAAVSNGLEMTDATTGDIYCVQISDGDWVKRLGSCAEQSIGSDQHVDDQTMQDDDQTTPEPDQSTNGPDDPQGDQTGDAQATTTPPVADDGSTATTTPNTDPDDDLAATTTPSTDDLDSEVEDDVDQVPSDEADDTVTSTEDGETTTDESVDTSTETSDDQGDGSQQGSTEGDQDSSTVSDDSGSDEQTDN